MTFSPNLELGAGFMGILNVRILWIIPLVLAAMLSTHPAFAHAVTEGDKGYILEITGIHLIPFTYLGAKHMVTGYDQIWGG